MVLSPRDDAPEGIEKQTSPGLQALQLALSRRANSVSPECCAWPSCNPQSLLLNGPSED